MTIDRLIRSNRTTVSLEITPFGELLVRAPRTMSLSRIEAIVRRRAEWIELKQREARARQAVSPGLDFRDGARFAFQGKTYPLRIVAGVPGRFIFRNEAFFLDKSVETKARAYFQAWYRQQAWVVIPERVRHFARLTGLKPAAVRITAARRRWGSCGPGGTINFAWRLVMTPPVVIDYVVIHELVHLKIKNHSVKFWDRVGELYPAYKEAKQWLKDNAAMLELPW